MGSKSDQESIGYSTEEINKEIDLNFEYLVREHINLQKQMISIRERYYNGVINYNFKTDVETNNVGQQLILQFMCFLSQERNFHKESNKHMELIDSEIKKENQQYDLFIVLKEKYIDLSRSESITAKSLAEQMVRKKAPFIANGLWRILYLLTQKTGLESDKTKYTKQKSVGIEILKSIEENFKKFVQESRNLRQQQENLIEDMNKAKTALEELILENL